MMSEGHDPEMDELTQGLTGNPVSGRPTRTDPDGDLWDLEAEEGGDKLGQAAVGQAGLPPANLPARRESRHRQRSGAIMTNVTARSKSGLEKKGQALPFESKGKSKPDLLRVSPGRLEDEFHNLDEWDDDSEPPASSEMLKSKSRGRDHLDDSRFQDELDSAPDLNKPTEEERKARAPLRWVERVGLMLLVIVFCGLAVGGYHLMFRSISSASGDLREVQYPVQGEHVVITSAQSYWREPTLNGENRDLVRRGTRLIPVVELKISGNPAAVRVRMKNESGRLVGDPLTRMISETGTYTFTGTAGFEDVGMHAAYRIGETEAWTFEVQEAESLDSTGDEYKLLFETEISPDKR